MSPTRSGVILLGSKATERTVKSLSASGALAGYRVLHFATHGLLHPRLSCAGALSPQLSCTAAVERSDRCCGRLLSRRPRARQMGRQRRGHPLSQCEFGAGALSAKRAAGEIQTPTPCVHRTGRSRIVSLYAKRCDPRFKACAHGIQLASCQRDGEFPTLSWTCHRFDIISGRLESYGVEKGAVGCRGALSPLPRWL